MSSSLDMIKNASAYIGAGDSRGTGYLVSQDFVVTCAHVVDNIADGETAILRFGEEETSFEATLIKRDEQADCALLKLKTPLTNTKPLKLYTGPFRRGDTWESYGFPAITKEVGHWLSGDVQDPNGKDINNNRAIALFSREVAAGQGVAAQGFSGSPILVGGMVVGHLKSIIPNKTSGSAPRAELGTLYATPASFIAQMLPQDAKVKELPPRPPGGYDPNWYIHREEEQTLAMYALTYSGNPVVLQAPFQFGKTNLLQYLLYLLRNDESEPATIVTINLEQISERTKNDADLLIKEIAIQLMSDLYEHNPKFNKDWVRISWDSEAGVLSKMTDLMEKHVLPHIKNKLVLAIDNADTIGAFSCKNDFFNLLRSFTNDTKDIWSSFRLIIAISASPTELVDNLHVSPFNNCETIVLKDFEDSQIYQLLEKYNLFWSATEVSKLKDAVGGHPYLLRLLMYRSKITKSSLATLLKDQNKLFDNYLNKYRKWLSSNPKFLQELKLFKSNNYALVRSNEYALEYALGSDEALCRRMTRAGLLLQNEDNNKLYRLRYKIYEHL